MEMLLFGTFAWFESVTQIQKNDESLNLDGLYKQHMYICLFNLFINKQLDI